MAIVASLSFFSAGFSTIEDVLDGAFRADLSRATNILGPCPEPRYHLAYLQLLTSSAGSRRRRKKITTAQSLPVIPVPE